MNRAELINHLLSVRRGTRYLEVGVHAEEDNFAHVRAAHKVGVDVDPVTTFCGTSDEFFAQNRDVFHLVFIDGLHTEQQVARDIENAYRCLAPGGCVVLHDCLPPDAWHQRDAEQYNQGENWNGTVWKAALREFNRTTHRCCIVDADWGCGVIDTSAGQIPARRELPESLDYSTHYPLLLDYIVSASALVRDSVRVFYHLACTGDWRQVFEEQLLSLREAGFRSIRLTALGSDEQVREAQARGAELGVAAEAVFQAPELTRFEAPAMQAVEAYAREHEGHVLYLHSKGVSSPGDEMKARWRRLMMRELVEGWEERMPELAHHDAIGVNWRDMPPISHFSGNFWYASTSYLRRLADFATYYANPRYQVWDAISDARLGCEFWIGSGDLPPHVLSLVCRNEDFCTPAFWATDH
jgi:SAM-dependent methyltransferase